VSPGEVAVASEIPITNEVPSGSSFTASNVHRLSSVGSQNNFGIIPDIHSPFLRATDDCVHPEAYNAGLVGG
jgi:hypothetical protein